MFKNLVRAWKRTHDFTITKINCLMIFKEVVSVPLRIEQNSHIGLQDEELLIVKAGVTYD
jgi:predicted metal-binding protein